MGFLYLHKYIHTYIYTYIYTCIHTCIPVLFSDAVDCLAVTLTSNGLIHEGAARRERANYTRQVLFFDRARFEFLAHLLRNQLVLAEEQQPRREAVQAMHRVQIV